jgi:hypothetical protein
MRKRAVMRAVMEQLVFGHLRHRPSGSLLRRMIRQYPDASTDEVMRLFLEAAASDTSVLEDVAMEVLAPKMQQWSARADGANECGDGLS